MLPVVVAPNNQFSPETQITRADFTEMVVGAMYVDVSKIDTSGLKQKFKDWGAIPQEAMPYVTVAVAKGIIGGYQDSTFRSGQTLTRAEACVILKKAFFPDLKMQLSQYYVDTVADVQNVTSMAVASDNTLYYVDNNTVYHVVNGKSEAVLTGNITEPISISTEYILQKEQELYFLGNYGFTLKHVKEQLEQDTEVEFTGLNITGVLCDPVTGKNYALTWSGISKYQEYNSLYMMALFDLDLSAEPALAFSSATYSSSENMKNNAMYAGMPVYPEYIYSIYNNQIFYSPVANNIIRWNITTGKMVVSEWQNMLNSINHHETFSFNDIFFVDDIPYQSYGYDNNVSIVNLKDKKTINIDGINGIAEDYKTNFRSHIWNHEYYFGEKCYIGNGENDIRIYRVSLPNTNVSKIKAEVLVDGREIKSKDGLPFNFEYINLEYGKQTQLWTPDADGTLYFYDISNRVIRKLYGVP